MMPLLARKQWSEIFVSLVFFFFDASHIKYVSHIKYAQNTAELLLFSAKAPTE